MSSFSEWFRKFANRLCKTHVPDKFLLPQLAGNLEINEARHFKKLVVRGRLAPFYPGDDEPTPRGNVNHPSQNLFISLQSMECPICCMYYHVMNKTRCCGQRLCSECIVKARNLFWTYRKAVSRFESAVLIRVVCVRSARSLRWMLM